MSICSGVDHNNFFWLVGIQSNKKIIIWGEGAKSYIIPDDLDCVKQVCTISYYIIVLKENGNVIVLSPIDYVNNLISDDLTGVKCIYTNSNHNYCVSVKIDGTIQIFGNTPCESMGVIPEGLDEVDVVSCGETNIVALKKDKSVIVWGKNLHGQCDVPLNLGDIKSILSCDKFIMGLKPDGIVRVWGWYFSELSDIQTQMNLGDIKEIYCVGHATFMGLRTNGKLIKWCYFDNNVDVILDNVKDVNCVKNNLFVLLNDGNVFVIGTLNSINILAFQKKMLGHVSRTFNVKKPIENQIILFNIEKLSDTNLMFVCDRYLICEKIDKTQMCLCYDKLNVEFYNDLPNFNLI